MKFKCVIVAGVILTAFISFTSNCSNLLDKYNSNSYDPQPEVIAQNAVGATTSTTLRTLDFSPDDSNAVFVSQLSGNDVTGTGTQTNPVATINQAITLCDAQHQKVVILDSETYEEQGFEFTGDFKGLYAVLGETPVIKPIWKEELRDGAYIYQPAKFSNNSTTLVDSALLNNGNWVVCYSDVTDSYRGKFIIYNQAGNVIAGPTTFETGTITWTIRVIVLTGGRFVIAYTLGNNWFGHFIIYNQDGSLNTASVEFEAGTVAGMNAAALNNGNFVVCYEPNDEDATLGRFKIYNNNGVLQAGPVNFVNEASNVSSFSIGVLGNNWVATYGGANGTSYGKFYIYSQTGSYVAGPVTFQSSQTSETNVTVLSNGNWVCCYRANGAAYFVIYNSAGTVVIGPTLFNNGNTYYIKTAALDGEWICSFSDGSDGGKGKYIIYSNSGTQITAPDYFFPKRIVSNCITKISNDNLLFCFSDNTDSNSGVFAMVYPNSWSGINVSTDAVINGITFDADSISNLTKIIKVNPSASFTMQYCDIKNIINPVASFTSVKGYAVYSYSNTNIKNCKIYNNDAGVYIYSDYTNITNSQFYFNNNGNALQIEGAASIEGDILISHSDFYSNSSGVRLKYNNGVNEVIKNSIFHNNDAYGINAETSITLSNSVITDSVLNTAYGVSVETGDPLYINDGNTNPEDIDLNLQTILMGYPNDSPAIDLADDGRNAGAYDVEYVNE